MESADARPDRDRSVAAIWSGQPRSAGEGIVAAYAVNELDSGPRRELLGRLVAGPRSGSRVLVVEPIARTAGPLLARLGRAFHAAGGRAGHLALPAVLPERMKLLDKAAGLDHRELTARRLARLRGALTASRRLPILRR